MNDPDPRPARSNLSDRHEEIAAYRRKEIAAKRRGRKARGIGETAIPAQPTRVAPALAQPPPRRELHTFRSLREIYLIPRSTAYHLIGQGKLRRVKVGHRSYVTDASVQALINGEAG
jgi:hypothetical protein